MRADRVVANRWLRISLLAGMVVGWALIAIAIASESSSLGVVGVALVGLGNLLLAKAFLELRSTTLTIGRASRHTDRVTAKALMEIEGLRAVDERLQEVDVHQEQALERLRSEAASLEERLVERVRGVERSHTTDTASQSAAMGDMHSRLEALAGAHEVTRIGLTATRAMTDKLAHQGRQALLASPRLRAAAHNQVDSPLLSIAIPSYNRPDALSELLKSIAGEVAACPSGMVELCITDDASPDPETVEVALTFVEKHRFASLRVQPSNIGLERNVLAASEPCRGEYMWLVGNDDCLISGSLETVLDDVRAARAPVLLYSKRRMRLDGSPSPEVAGSIPIDLPPEGHHLFSTLVEAASRQGLLSTFGFAGPIVLRRTAFVAVDPTPYLDLSMYARTCVLIESFADQPVLYRNTQVVIHRTPTQAEKNAEALSRPEEEFMQGGLALSIPVLRNGPGRLTATADRQWCDRIRGDRNDARTPHVGTAPRPVGDPQPCHRCRHGPASRHRGFDRRRPFLCRTSGAAQRSGGVTRVGSTTAV